MCPCVCVCALLCVYVCACVCVCHSLFSFAFIYFVALLLPLLPGNVYVIFSVVFKFVSRNSDATACRAARAAQGPELGLPLV